MKRPDEQIRTRRHPWRLWLLVGVAVLIGLAIALRTVVPFTSEAARRQVVRVLAERLDSEVELQSFRLQVFPTFRAEGDGLTIRHRGRRDVPPLISIAHFAAEGDLATLLRKHVSLLTVQGLDIEIPPDRNRAPTQAEGEGAEERPSAPARPGEDDRDR